MSVPRPAMFVAIVTAPLRPIARHFRFSFNVSGFAFKSSARCHLRPTNEQSLPSAPQTSYRRAPVVLSWHSGDFSSHGVPFAAFERKTTSVESSLETDLSSARLGRTNRKFYRTLSPQFSTPVMPPVSKGSENAWYVTNNRDCFVLNRHAFFSFHGLM